MTAPAKAKMRNGMLARVHCAKRDLAMDDPTYRAILERLFGAASASELTLRQLDELLRHFEGLGWQPKARASAKARDKHGEPKLSDQDHRWPLLRKIEALLAEMGTESGQYVPWSYAAAILERMFGVKRLEWATTAQLSAVIAALANGGGRRKGSRYRTIPAEMVQKVE